jgi:hypothetical protein
VDNTEDKLAGQIDALASRIERVAAALAAD